MRFYVAAKFEHAPMVCSLQRALATRGPICTATWATGELDGLSKAELAAIDLQAIDDSDGVIVYQYPYDAPALSIGRHIETGYA